MNINDRIVRRTFKDITDRQKGAYSSADRAFLNASHDWLQVRYGLNRNLSKASANPKEFPEGSLNYDELCAGYRYVIGEADGMDIHHICFYKYGDVEFWDADVVGTGGGLMGIDYHDMVIVFPDAVTAVEFKLSVG